jgi:RNA polymerase sigma factor (sigma-70 family)
MTQRPVMNPDVAKLLRRLNGADSGAAWVEFIDRYAQLIMRTAGQIEFEHDRVNECFLFVCEKLSEDGFRRLMRFNTAGKAHFRTWLTTVTFNLCVDWHRREYGRMRLLPALAALPEFDRSVYRLVIEQGMTKESAYQTLRADHPDLGRESLNNSLHRIHGLLTPRQRWQISVKRGRTLDRGSTAERLELLADPGADPPAEADSSRQKEAIDNALAQLPRDQRLLLYWRFQEGLSLSKIAELAELGNTDRAWRRIQAAVDALIDLVNGQKFTGHRKN